MSLYAYARAISALAESHEETTLQPGWPVLWTLRGILPHPLEVEESIRAEFQAAVAALPPVVPRERFLLERMLRQGAEQRNSRIVVDHAAPSGGPETAVPQTAGSIEDYLRDGYCDLLLELCGSLLRRSRPTMPLSTYALPLAETERALGLPLSPPSLFTLVVPGWKPSYRVLRPLISTRYAQLLAERIGLPVHRLDPDVWAEESLERCLHLLLFETVLREAAGSVRALALDPVDWIERTRPRVERVLGNLRRFVELATQRESDASTS